MQHWRRAGLVGLPALALLITIGGYAAWRMNFRLWPPSVVRRLPASETLVYLDLRPLRGAFRGMPIGGSAYAAFVRESGFDYSRDLDELALALRGDPAHPSSACAILDGRFPRSFVAYLSQHARRKLIVAGLTSYLFPGFARPQQAIAVAPISSHLVVLTNAPDPAADIGHARSAWKRASRLWQAPLWRPLPVAYLAEDTLTLAAERHLDARQPPWAGTRQLEVSLRLTPPDALNLQAVAEETNAQAATDTQAWASTELDAISTVLGQNPSAGSQLAGQLRDIRLNRSGRRLAAALRLNASELRDLLAVSAGQ